MQKIWRFLKILRYACLSLITYNFYSGPSVCQYVPSQASCLHLNAKDIFVGCDNGTVIHYELAPDCNKLDHKIDILSHVGRVTAIHYTNGSVLSVSRDKTFVWADLKSANIIASHAFTAWCTALQWAIVAYHSHFEIKSSSYFVWYRYDVSSGHAFVGDFGKFAFKN